MIKAYKVNVNGKSYEVEVEEIGAVQGTAPVVQAPVASAPVQAPVAPAPVAASTGEIVEAPMPGVVVDVKVKVGDTVKDGDLIAVLEAMKMETDLFSTKSGVVTAIVGKGATVNTGDAIITL